MATAENTTAIISKTATLQGMQKYTQCPRCGTDINFKKSNHLLELRTPSGKTVRLVICAQCYHEHAVRVRSYFDEWYCVQKARDVPRDGWIPSSCREEGCGS